MRRVFPLVALLLVVGVALGEEPLFRAPFDGNDEATLRVGQAETITPFCPMTGPFVPGVRGQARTLGGQNQCAFHANSGFFPPQGTMLLWARPEDWLPISAQNFVFLARVAFTEVEREYVRLLLYKYWDTGELTVLVQNTLVGDRTSLIQVPIGAWQQGQWHHLAVTWDAAKTKLYVDGQPVGEAPAITLPEEGRWELSVGSPDLGWAHVGEERTTIDEFEVYKRPMGPEEILARYETEVKIAPVSTTNDSTAAPSIEGNLATEANGAFILASSFANYESLYTDNLIDGDEQTCWQPLDPVLPQWLEVRWDVPVWADRVLLRQTEGGHLRAFGVSVWEQNVWREVAAVTHDTPPADRDLTAQFEQVQTRRLRVLLQDGDGDGLQVSTLAVTGPDQPLISRLKPYWHASYIWYPEPDEIHKANAPRYFRKAFALDSPEDVRSAVLQLRSNDYYQAFINGVPVATGSTRITPTDVRQHLVKGPNVLAVVADLKGNPGRWGWGELLFELALNYDDHSEYVVSDASVRSSDQGSEGWQSAGFDDRAWRPAAQFLQPPQGVWGAIPYQPSAVNERVQLSQLHITPAMAAPGDRVTVSLRLTPDKPLRDDYVFLLDAGQGAAFPDWEDWEVARATCVPSDPTSRWQPGAGGEIRFTIDLPMHAPAGAVPLRLTAFGQRFGASIDLLDDAGALVAQVGALQVHGPAAQPPTPDEMALHTANGTLRLRIGAKDVVPEMWALMTPSYDRYHAYSRTGVRIYHLKAMPMSYDERPETLQGTCETLDRRIEALLGVDPQALVIVMLDLRPTGQWLKEHPEERLITAFGNLGPVCYESRRYNEGIDRFLHDVIAYLKTRRYYERIVGYLPMSCGSPDSVMGGVDDNLFQKDRSKLTFGDYNPQAIAAFRGWLRSRYGDDTAALRAAWKDEAISFETATPVVAELTSEGADGGVFRDPRGSAMTADYFEWLSGVMGRWYSHVMGVVKAEAGRGVLAGTYYGYDVAHLRAYNNVGAWFQCNNFDLHTCLHDPNWDYFAAPTPYSNRLAGSPYYTSFSQDSVRLHGKLLIGEMDHRTFVAAPITYGRERSEDETASVMMRDMAGAMVDGAGYWFADWSSGRGRPGVGFFTDPSILRTVEQARQIHEQAMEQPRTGAAEIAVFTDWRTMAYQDLYRSAPVYDNLIPRTLWEGMGKIGAPYDSYMLDDLGEQSVQEGYKLYIFLSAFFLRPEDRERIEALKRDGKTLLFFYAPGYLSREAGLSSEGVSAVTGMTVAAKGGKELMEYSLLPGEHPVIRGLQPDTTFSLQPFGYALSRELHPPELGPVFHVNDPEATALAAYPDGRTALAARDFGDWKSVYCAAPFMDTALLRGVARFAGVHLYCEQDVVLKADGRMLTLHAGPDSPHSLTISLPGKRDVVDAVSGAEVAHAADRFDIELGRRDTRVLWLR